MATEQTCLIIGPIGAPDSESRRNADRLFHEVIEPAVQGVALGLCAVRSDHISRPGDINKQVIELLLKVPLVICDMTDRNANAFYELAIRHAVGTPCIHLHKLGDPPPFDVSTMRASAYTFGNLSNSIRQLTLAIRAAMSPEYIPENPLLEVLSSSWTRKIDLGGIAFNNWNHGRSNLISAMQKAYQYLDEQTRPMAPLSLSVLGSIEALLALAAKAGRVLLAAVSFRFDIDEISFQDISAVARECGVIATEVDWKRLGFDDPDSFRRLFFDVLTVDLAHVGRFCELASTRYNMSYWNWGIGPIPDIWQPYYKKSIFRH